MKLRDHQTEALKHLGNGNILWGGVGSGKTATALAYYVEKESPKDIYVITTAKKRDSLDWIGEAVNFGIGEERDCTNHGIITVDSWNNIKNYVDKEDAFFVFDEQRLVGSGAWVKAFLKIAKRNNWIMLSATPGDTWMDYAPIFVANGLYKNITRFKLEHVMYEPYIKYPKIRMYLNERLLEQHRNDILVEMPFIRETTRYLNWLPVSHDVDVYNKVYKERWHIFEDRPIKDAAELFRTMRKVVNMDPSRLETIIDLMKCHPKLIIFYNFNYELEILRGLGEITPTFEWNGHRKDELPEGDNWVYLVQYVAGAEGWNCTTTNGMVLYSMPYSYKNFEQAQGRIDRLDTPFKDLHYYVLLSYSKVDEGIRRALVQKKSFNERKYLIELEEFDDPADEIVESCQI